MNCFGVGTIGLVVLAVSSFAQGIGEEPPKLELTATLDSPHSIFLRGESIGRLGVTLTLTNRGERTATVTAVDVAMTTGDLRVEIAGPDGKPVGREGPRLLKNARDWHFDIKGSGVATETVKLKQFGYHELHEVGEHTIQVRFNPRPGEPELVAKPIKITVVDVKESDILSTVVAAGDQIDRLNGEGVALIQQIKVGDKVYLFHRTAIRKDGQISAPHRSARVTELGEKREITVSGSYALGKPLTISYKTAPDAKPTKLVINSISGSPWMEAEERRSKDNSPRPIKP